MYLSHVFQCLPGLYSVHLTNKPLFLLFRLQTTVFSPPSPSFGHMSLKEGVYLVGGKESTVYAYGG